jgi:hypothetical protein
MEGALVTNKEKVLNYFPSAYLHWQKSRIDIRRPREQGDGPALVGYVILSGLHWTEEEAWHDAANRVQILETQ